MALSKMPFLSAMHLRNSLTRLTMRLKSDNAASPPSPSKQCWETRPKQPQSPMFRFMNERKGKIMSELNKEAWKRWKEMSEEEKRPFVDSYEAAIENWKDERALMKAKFEAMEEEDKSGEKEHPHYHAWSLFISEVQIPDATSSDFTTKASQMWNDLTPEEREAYHERARKINEKGQADLIASTMKKMKSKNYGLPQPAPLQFRNKFLSDGLKEALKEVKREWSELTDKERENYVKQFEVETKLFNAHREKYRAGDKYAENKRKVKVLRAKIKQIEEDMNKPKLLARNSINLFSMDKREFLTGKNAPEQNIIITELWKALTEEERMEYKAKWSKLRADWQIDVAQWEERNGDNPKMTDLKARKMMLEMTKKELSY